jgi:hypothetical protein
MAKKLYHVGLRWVKTQVTTEKIDELNAVFSALGDWMRLNALNYYIWTDSPPRQTYEMLRSVFLADDSIFVIAVDPNDMFGWLPEWVWEWLLDKRRPPSSY